MEELKRKRATIKGQLTRGCNFINDAPGDDLCMKELIEERLDKLSEYFKEFNDVQFWIEGLITNVEELKTESESQRSEVEQKYYQARAKGKSLLKGLVTHEGSDNNNGTAVHETSIDKINSAIATLLDHQATLGELVSRFVQPRANHIAAVHQTVNQFSDVEQPISPPQIPEVESYQAPAQTSASLSRGYPYPEIKLSPIKLQIFDGKLKNWPSFHDMYVSLIHNNPKLSNTQKFYYLKSSLSHDAASSINSFDITEVNYIPAYEQLVATYSKENFIVEEHLKAIMDQPGLSYVSEEGLRALKSSVSDSVGALKAMKIPTDYWDCWLVFVVSSKLDKSSQQLWRRESAQKKNPTFKELLEFFDRRIYEVCMIGQRSAPRPSTHKFNPPNRARCAALASSICVFCPENHYIEKCPGFGKLSIKGKRDFVKKHGLCFNCLRKGHISKICQSSCCQLCNRKHNTLLHEDSTSTYSRSSTSTNPAEQISESQGSPLPSGNAMNTLSTTQNSLFFASILPTALVLVMDPVGNWHLCKALLDSGSQVSLLTEACAQRLNLPRTNARIAINGVGTEASTFTKRAVNLQIKSRTTNEQLCVPAYILREIVSTLSSVAIENDCKRMIQGLALADPSFEAPGKIDILLGCDVFFRIMGKRKLESESKSSIALETIFGWVISGKPQNNQGKIGNLTLTTCLNVDQTLKQFWEVESIRDTTKCTEEEQCCEDHFVATHKRLSSGRYMVRLPFKQSIEKLGNSRNMAARRFSMLERRFENNSSLKKEYSKFIEEYLSLGHMTEVSEGNREVREEEAFYMPHHAVFKLDSSSTKLRVVFDASAPSTSGHSLNSLLLNGPKIQSDLVEILGRFRKYRIGYTADIAKMYRQVMMHPKDALFQRILWRKSVSQPVREYSLQTVTYGTTPAPFLAIRTLKQLALDEGDQHPVGAENLLNNFYVDDFIGGCDTIEDALGVKTDLCHLLAKGGFDLRKWASNSAEFIRHIPEHNLETSVLSLSEGMAIKTLGLYWNPSGDFFFFKVSLGEQKIASKRIVLSEISRIFDPFGWVSPTIIMAKVLIQDLWIAGVSWDDPLPPPLMKNWFAIRRNLKCLENISIPRWIGTEGIGYRKQLHGFSDASERAYAACVYISVYTKGSYVVSLLASKTKVAPVNRISIPKLELCGAHLLAKLIGSVKRNMGLDDADCYAWTDSQVVLAWLSQHPSKWKTFVGNRTSEILETVPKSRWRHVPSKLNPADCASRGLQPNLLPSFDLWWKGPRILGDMDAIENNFILKSPETDLEKRNTSISLATTAEPTSNPILIRYSSLTRLKRITAWCRRFIFNTKTRDRKKRKFGWLSTNELETEFNFWIKETQNTAFSLELSRLKSAKEIRRDSNLKSLDPFVGDDGILRVGGRIQRGKFVFQQKHPTILPKESHLTTLIVAHYHHKYLHAGPHLILGVIRQYFWILHLKGVVVKFIRRCVTCQRYKARPLDQQMGNLPKVRLEMSKPFTNTGMDYAGPLNIQAWKGRGAKHHKCYVALFICLSTRAIHLELVSDLTSDAVIAALKRFVARRGAVKRILSDNGSNFVGASRELQGFYKLIKSSESVHKYLADEEIHWEFIPPHAPHFGGIWEAGVKSTKFHLRRVMGQTSLTFEELSTLLCQIEMCLNSRPLTPIINDKVSLEPLTPNYLLTGGPVMTLPELYLCDAKLNTLSRWQYTQRLQQEFWRRWQREYLHQLQQRTRWTLRKRNMELNDLVLVVDNNLSPSKWLMGRVVKLFPGADDLIRVVEIRTKSGIMRRDITKLALLLPNED